MAVDGLKIYFSIDDPQNKLRIQFNNCCTLFDWLDRICKMFNFQAQFGTEIKYFGHTLGVEEKIKTQMQKLQLIVALRI